MWTTAARLTEMRFVGQSGTFPHAVVIAIPRFAVGPQRTCLETARFLPPPCPASTSESSCERPRHVECHHYAMQFGQWIEVRTMFSSRHIRQDNCETGNARASPAALLRFLQRR